jgi:aspartyl-tRNA(Asn)/glutamyl-tRNA(Gln) amidotransferase subunit C
MRYSPAVRVTAETVDHVAALAQLALTAEERERFARQLEEILTYAESIQALELEGVEPMSHAFVTGVFRDDAPRPSLDRARVLDAAPESADGLLLVPRIIGG